MRSDMETIFGFQDFLSPAQEQSVHAVLNGEKNVIVNMATISGKSLCFQLAGAMQPKGTIVVLCPNLILMENQMNYLNEVGLRAKAINNRVSNAERDEIVCQLLDEDTKIKFFYLCPEMADTKKYLINDLVERKLITHIVVDEAHCIVDPDKSFREAFEVVGQLRQEYPQIPFIALTSGSPQTIRGIQDALGMPESTKIINASSVKKNILYKIKCFMNDQNPDLLGFMKSLTPDQETLQPNQIPSGIIYCTTNYQVDKVVEQLALMNIAAKPFYGTSETRFENYDDWMSDKIPIIVATTESFGMGIVKNVKFVLHFDIPKSLHGFYQESGRAGLKGDHALSVVFCKNYDLKRRDEVSQYLTTNDCRRKFLAKYFGEDCEDCRTMCDNCLTTTN